ncbi:MAG: chemotaxis-specific protein-glutamate methyltransferase CheB [Thermodesulfobacteriota bacterium]
MNVAIVNDMLLARESLRRVIAASGRHTVAWLAENGQQAVDRCRQHPPDIILMDMIMPVMNGVQATRIIMEQTPCPILVVTASVTGNSSLVFEAMGAGALDVVATPVLAGGDTSEGAEQLIAKINRIERLCKASERNTTAAAKVQRGGSANREIVLLGASTGGPQVLLTILSQLPPSFADPIVVIQHMDEKFTPSLARWMNDQIPLEVRVFREGDMPVPGTVHVASTSHHAVMRPDTGLGYTRAHEDNFYHPSIDIFYNSVASHWPGTGTAVLLTGMGRDGGQGMLALRNRGFRTIAQDAASCIVYGIPRYAKEIGAAARILTPTETAAFLLYNHHA